VLLILINLIGALIPAYTCPDPSTSSLAVFAHFNLLFDFYDFFGFSIN
jgi:hypothetical protein